EARATTARRRSTTAPSKAHDRGDRQRGPRRRPLRRVLRRSPMSRFLFRLGHSSARHPWRVVLLWVLAAGVAVGLRGYVGGEPNDDFQLPGTETQAARDLLEEQFPEQAGSTGQVVFAAES